MLNFTGKRFGTGVFLRNELEYQRTCNFLHVVHHFGISQEMSIIPSFCSQRVQANHATNVDEEATAPHTLPTANETH